MPEEIRINRPNVQGSPRGEMPEREFRDQRRGSSAPWIVLVLVIIVIAVVAVLFRDKIFSKGGSGSGAAMGKSSGYQAVFLTNGQVYFGKMSDATDSYVMLKDIFYLQVNQPQIQGSQQSQQQAQQQPQLSLVKLGQELHGPVDEMHINRSQILFYEDMKEDGKVFQAMKEYKANPQGAGQGQGATPTPGAEVPTGQQQTPKLVTPPPPAKTVTPPPPTSN